MKQISWEGGGDHEGHTVTAIEQWPVQVENCTLILNTNPIQIKDGSVTCGRVRCSCGEEWNVGGWPTEVAEQMWANQ